MSKHLAEKQKNMQMKHLIHLVLLLLLFGSCTPAETTDNQREPIPDLPQISLLGIFHFAGTTDYSSVEFESLESEQRQAEIMDILDQLERFQPTKVLVEYPSARAARLDSTYQAYLAGTQELTINEIEQLGFRLAERMEHASIYAIDFPLDLPFGELIAYAEEHDKERFEAFLASIEAQDELESEYLAENSLLDYLIFRNTDEEDIRNKDQYLNGTAKFVNDTTYIGAEFAAKWWERNFMMMSNIDQLMEENDRLLVIVGAAHRAILRDFFEDRRDVEYVEIRELLEMNQE